MTFDFAIFGSSPLALLLSACLAGVHGKSVCRVGQPWSAWPLPRRFDVAYMVTTRPASWAQLRQATTETTKVINSLGKGLVEKLEPLLIAETHASVEALAHLRASAAGTGYTLEQAADRSLTSPAQAWRLRDIAALVRGKAEPALVTWGERAGVQRVAHDSVTLRRDGTARIRSATIEADATTSILCDDAAIAEWLDESGRERLLRPVAAQTIVTEPARPLAAPLVRYIDRGVTLGQPGKGGGVTAIVDGADQPMARLGACLAPQGPLRRAADLIHTRFETLDGAPLVATARGPKVQLVAGFGDTAVFFAPLLARHFAGVSTSDEAAFVAAHDVGRGNARQAVADFMAEGL